jgi:hypothetical protein
MRDRYNELKLKFDLLQDPSLLRDLEEVSLLRDTVSRQNDYIVTISKTHGIEVPPFDERKSLQEAVIEYRQESERQSPLRELDSPFNEDQYQSFMFGLPEDRLLQFMDRKSRELAIIKAALFKFGKQLPPSSSVDKAVLNKIQTLCKEGRS